MQEDAPIKNQNAIEPHQIGGSSPIIEKRPTKATAGIKAFSHKELVQLMETLNQPKFRAIQIEQWVYGKGARSYGEMTNLSKALRGRLASDYPIYYPVIVTKQVSRDKTRKYLLKLSDGVCVEAVGIPTKNRLTICYSTQAGCAIRCTFCATGKSGLIRNLAPGEMVDQIRIVAEDFGMRPTNAVAMGQGEPFMNYDNVLAALRFINSKDGLSIGARHLTVSTSGILPQIRRFAQEPEQFTFAVSLHSALQETRNTLMPGVRQYTLERLRDSLKSYAETTGRRLSLEFAMIDGVNDTDRELNALQKFCHGLLCHVNLIQLNPIRGSKYQPSPIERINFYMERLNSTGIECTIRNSRGRDIEGACGQLKQNPHQISV